MIKKALFIAVIILAIFPQSGHALTIFGDGTLGHFTGSFSYSPTSSTQGTVTVVLKNTSPTANGGYLTAFVFNNPGNQITGVTLSATDTDFSVIGGSSFNNRIRASPYGRFDIGASIGGRFLGGGSPVPGISVGTTETFTFTFTGTALNTLNDGSFVSTLSSRATGGNSGQFFTARFRGFNNCGSDKVPGIVPEPASLSLLGLGLFGFLRFRSKFKIRKRREVNK